MLLVGVYLLIITGTEVPVVARCVLMAARDYFYPPIAFIGRIYLLYGLRLLIRSPEPIRAECL